MQWTVCVVHFPNVLVGDPLLSSIASQMVGDFQPSVGEKTYTFEDVQGVSVYMCEGVSV